MKNRFLVSPDTCPMRHVGYCLSGRLMVRMVQTDKEKLITPGDFFEIPPGHDAYVEGSERVELILFGAPS
jgi:mannose-6-phosphate isomerase-like protein (cupin superfamily)